MQLYNKKDLAIIAGISFYLLPAVSVSSFLISTDVFLIFFWSLSLLYLLKIRKDPRYINFLLLGIFLGLSFLTKYATIYFFLSLILFLCLEKNYKILFFKNLLKSSLFIISFILVLLPNILWNIENNWVTLSHTSDNASLNTISIDLIRGLEFLLTQGLMVGPLIFISFFLFFKKTKLYFEEKFLLSFSLPIFLIVFIESILVRANANWAAVALITIFIYFLHKLYFQYKKIIFVNNLINLIFCLFLFISIATTSSLHVFDRISGISNFAHLIEEKYIKNKEFLVIEDRLLYSSIRYELKNTQKKVFAPHNPKNKIKSHFHLSDPLPANFKKNFIFIGDPSNIRYLQNTNKIKKIISLDVIFKKTPIVVYEVIF